jgi:hypothetical protein
MAGLPAAPPERRSMLRPDHDLVPVDWLRANGVA